jgi:tetratricopeptide (TPR) repeat protein
MLPSITMRRLFSLLAVALLAACGISDPSDTQNDWLHVLSRKRAAAAPAASVHARQAYADSIAAFVEKHPRHSRAREVYEHVQLDFAGELASIGRYQDAIRIYRAVLGHDPADVRALAGLSQAMDRLAVSRQKLLALEKGMSQKEVARILGKPIPGWTVTNDHRDTTIDAWYYRTSEGGVAGVYFRDGLLFAAEENSQARLTSMTR